MSPWEIYELCAATGCGKVGEAASLIEGPQVEMMINEGCLILLPFPFPAREDFFLLLLDSNTSSLLCF